ncbi:MAG: SsrA-binding protein SmpB [Eubacteriales bacterium]|jgi:SsrA-binding protein
MATKKVITTNKKAYHDYFVTDTYEAGVELCGTEVKSLRLGQVNLKDSYCRFKNGEMFIEGMHISPYEKGNIFNRDPYRPRKVLMHKREILKLFGLVGKQGYTLVPLSMYFSGKWVKAEIGLCKGKKLYDKREDEAKKTASREIDRAGREKF